MKNNSTPLLTISLLISNRPDTIPRCLDSLASIREAVQSELILIDTSKNEDIHQMLLAYTDQVYEFEWCQDFAKARNEGVRRAKGEWFMYLDDDEWFVESDEIVKFFQSGAYKNFGSANIMLRNFLNADYTEYTDTWVSRLFRLEENVRFVGKVHEYMQYFDDRHIFLQTLANHTGYILDTPEKRRKHFERNATLLFELVEEEPDNMRWQGQMVQEYRSVKEWEAIIEFSKKQLKKEKLLNSYMDYNHFCTLYAGCIEALMKLERCEEALVVCEQALKDPRSTELLKAYVHICSSECYATLENWEEARISAERYLECYENFDPENTSTKEQLGALIIQHAFDEEYLGTAQNIFLYTGARRGDAEAIQAWEEKRKADMEKQELKQLERQVLIGPGIRVLEYYEVLKAYAQKKVLSYTQIHGEIKSLEELPAEVHAALKFHAYIELEGKDRGQALARLKEAVDICPRFAHGISRFFHFYSQLEVQRVEKQKEEMKALRNQVMEQVNTMLTNGQTQEALQIIAQLKQMFSEDLEVTQLGLETQLKRLE